MSLRPDWISPSQAMDMMFTDPLGSSNGLSFGLLRTSMRGIRNSISGFAFAKLNPEEPVSIEPGKDYLWPVTAAKAGVALAPSVEDLWQDPAILFSRYEAELLPGRSEGLIVTTLRFSIDHSRHDMFDMGYAFAIERLARRRRLSTLVVLHVPGDASSRSEPHVHLVSVARRHSPSGFGCYDDELFCDRGQQLLSKEWQRFSSGWKEHLQVS